MDTLPGGIDPARQVVDVLANALLGDHQSRAGPRRLQSVCRELLAQCQLDDRWLTVAFR